MILVSLHDRNDVLVKRLGSARLANYHEVLNSDGAGSFQIHRADPDVSALGILTGGIDGWIVHLLRMGQYEDDFFDRFAFVVESVTVGLDDGEDSSAWITVGGRGTLCLLEDRIAFPPGFDGAAAASIFNQWREYVAVPGGSIIAGELDHSSSRFSVALTHSKDSRTTYQQAVLADAPSGYWRLGDTSGTTADLGSGNHPGTVHGTVTRGQPGLLFADPDPAMVFDGSTGYIQTSGLPQAATTAWSLEAVIRPKAFSGSSLMTVLVNGSTGADGYAIGVGGAGGTGGTHLVAELHGIGYVDSGYALPTPNAVYHVVLTYDNANLRFYVNGALQATVAHTAPNTPTAQAVIGADGATDHFFNGTIDEAAVYPSTLSAARVTAHYNAFASYYQPVSASTVSQTAKLRFDNLRKLHDFLVSNGMDGQMAGLDYQAQDHRGTDNSAKVTIQFSSQDSMRAVQLERDARPVKNYVVAQGTGEGINAKLASSSDSGGITALRRREGFLQAAQVDDQSQLNLQATSAVAQLKDADQRITTRFIDSPATQLYRDLSLGDTITLKAWPVNWTAPYRVIGISVADTEQEIEEVALDLNDMKQEYLAKLATNAQLSADQLNVIATQPQGATFNDSVSEEESCDLTHPFRFRFFVPSNLLELNYAKLSFQLLAFRRDFNAIVGSSTTSAAGTAHHHTLPSHVHRSHIFQSNTPAGNAARNYQIANGIGLGVSVDVDSASGVDLFTDGPANVITSNDEASHTHTLTPNLSITDGVFESTTATNVTVKINGVDRTVVLGGDTGFNVDQAELEVAGYLTLGAWNEIDFTPATLGRIKAHLRLTGYIQSN